MSEQPKKLNSIVITVVHTLDGDTQNTTHTVAVNGRPLADSPPLAVVLGGGVGMSLVNGADTVERLQTISGQLYALARGLDGQVLNRAFELIAEIQAQQTKAPLDGDGEQCYTEP